MRFPRLFQGVGPITWASAARDALAGVTIAARHAVTATIGEARIFATRHEAPRLTLGPAGYGVEVDRRPPPSRTQENC